ncbi:hypothetical protein AA103587_0287 [Gluconobacter kanchanaburiensis NBRC 103587]|nr:hypothetical protein AA103587_0287 [Gluconobacter kanchanaburiensis NBRC 103587]
MHRMLAPVPITIMPPPVNAIRELVAASFPESRNPIHTKSATSGSRNVSPIRRNKIARHVSRIVFPSRPGDGAISAAIPRIVKTGFPSSIERRWTVSDLFSLAVRRLSEKR